MLAQVAAESNTWPAVVVGCFALFVSAFTTWQSNRGTRHELREHMKAEEVQAEQVAVLHKAEQSLIGDRFQFIDDKLALGASRMASLESGQARIEGKVDSMLDRQDAADVSLRETLRAVVAGNPEIRKDPNGQ